MNERFLTVESFHDLLQQWNGETIRIVKHELDDLDDITMQLETLSLGRNTRRIDAYEPMHTLFLNGTGTMETDARLDQPLPSSVYEIPIGDDTRYEFDGDQFLLSTSRGMYKIEKA